MPRALIALGSNLGDRQESLERSVQLLDELPQSKVLAVSSWRESEPVGGPPGQGNFLNGAVLVESSLTPSHLHASLMQIEDRLGRRRGKRWGPRTIDLDLLLFDGQVIDTPTLQVPHPRMAMRRFVLEGAAEIAGHMVHPTAGLTVRQLLEQLESSSP